MNLSITKQIANENGRNMIKYVSPEKTGPVNTKQKVITEKDSVKSLPTVSQKIFIVHGHDDIARLETASFVQSCGYDAVILREQANEGNTIIEKIENCSDVNFAIILYTPCDIGGSREKTPEEYNARARQNVVFEDGYLTAKLGRDHICRLVKGNIELPSDISGIAYIPMDEQGAWKFMVAREMKRVGLEVDVNKILK